MYYCGLKGLEDKGLIELPTIPGDCIHNAHMFYVKVKDFEERTALLEHLKYNDVLAVFHYVPLHSAPAGLKFGEFEGDDKFTTAESERIVRLPIFYGLTVKEKEYIIKAIYDYFHK